ncbi:MAG: V-type ATPase subunit [bacterium]|nr:V-type ATPase subunit [bacterium]
MEKYFSRKNDLFLDIGNLHQEDVQYGYSTGRLAILEKSILDKNAYRELIIANNTEETLRLLENKHGFKTKNHNTQVSWEDILNKEFISVHDLIYGLAPVKEIFDIFFFQYSFHNLKVRLKEKLAGHKIDTPLFIIGPVLLEESSPVLREIIIKIEQVFYKERRFQDIDCILDEEYFNFLSRVADKYKIPVIESLIKTWIDLANIKLFFRFKTLQRDKNNLSRFLFSGGNFKQDFYINTYHLRTDVLKRETKNIFYADLFLTGIKCLENETSMDELEKSCDRFILQRFSETKHIVFGIEPMIRYLLHKENEMRMLRMIFVGKENSISNNEIEEKIAGYYV